MKKETKDILEATTGSIEEVKEEVTKHPGFRKYVTKRNVAIAAGLIGVGLLARKAYREGYYHGYLLGVDAFNLDTHIETAVEETAKEVLN